ncbi:hypothetical protein L7F22_055167 [Adiantum nelumboides]|nr:hypothetical protein [Adiantum nelumboides]
MYGPQHPVTSFGPFEKWGIDAIGPLPRTANGKEYIIVGVDYMTRWAKALSTSRITAKDVANFIFNNICCKFGTPLEIISDRGPGFRGDLVGELMEKLGIKRRHSTPYYPQCNGLVEKVNGMICKIITKHVGDKAQKWNQHLDAALWAYRTSFKASLRDRWADGMSESGNRGYALSYCNQQSHKWIKFLHLVESAYNSSHHRSPGMSPFKALYGQQCLVPLQLVDPTLHVPATKSTLEMMDQQLLIIRDNLKRASDRQESYADFSPFC